ncbi:MAG: lipid-A-disaccharide synthase [Desulfobacteraceae bacterium]|nr:MAG: lipid-A-disaccharide synthase [Desulfobacteraceae bacterium]
MAINTMNQAETGKCVMIIAGEDSGDLHGANLINELKQQAPSLFLCGIGGEKMRKAGLKIVFHASELSVMGITEVVAKLPTILKAMGIAKKIVRNLKPDLLILIDFADFNLRVAKAAKKVGIPVLYYIPPKVWAWRSGRVKKIKARTDQLAVILPFEADFFQQHGLSATFIGHPLLDNPKSEPENDSRKEEKQETIIGLLPGSRGTEIRKLLPILLDTAKLIRAGIPDARFLVSLAPSADRLFIETMIRHHPESAFMELVDGPVDHIFRRADFLVAASGTVTLEAALAGVPMVIIYKVSGFSYMLGKSLANISHVGLANLIAGKEIIPELLQWKAKPERIAETVCTILLDPQKLSTMKNELRKIREKLGGPGASMRTAQLALKMMGLEKHPQTITKEI